MFVHPCTPIYPLPVVFIYTGYIMTEPLVYEQVFITITQSSYHCKSKVNRTNLAFDFRTLFVGYGSCWQFIYLCPERCTISMLGQSCMECENV